MKLPYLIELAQCLQAGLEKLPASRLEKHRQFLLDHQCEDGGFRGREGDSDLYYTGFAVRALALIGGLDSKVTDKITDYLRIERNQTHTPVDLLNWISCALAVQLAGGVDLLESDDSNSGESAETWRKNTFDLLDSLRRPDGGYAKGPEGKLGSTYQTFLVAVSHDLLGRPLPNPDEIVQFLFDRQRDDGGFVEIAPMKRSGTNPTAAAVATLKLLGKVDTALQEDVRDFIIDVAQDDGGVAANTRIPFGDALSTFTALNAHRDLEIDPRGLKFTAKDFITQGLEFPTGGFRAALWDEQADVEYTYYALGVLGLTS
ncbi:MAG: terpene cyclase/mutase family protein [Planctomycetaceae bacterium]|nr:terpene cyclase/mutase family protein [Planctomycetaceae bacterium]